MIGLILCQSIANEGGKNENKEKVVDTSVYSGDMTEVTRLLLHNLSASRESTIGRSVITIFESILYTYPRNSGSYFENKRRWRRNRFAFRIFESKQDCSEGAMDGWAYSPHLIKLSPFSGKENKKTKLWQFMIYTEITTKIVKCTVYKMVESTKNTNNKNIYIKSGIVPVFF